ncbi:glycosyl hydrolase [Chitinophaga polysaccharea]|uniref:glycoside hydrolase family 38 N-terminal domain-containing protein n=1 Tax=Chitinophaga polysaccharea TaxID=1293035 RepID=UPI0014556BBA|nr:glycoside hydrolase family 38 C-terminal domain-containing protein [Chitinophaga polysaccharea]NLR60535.1 glycosyl hydrolase [Chitinophaga polysaccharea]
MINKKNLCLISCLLFLGWSGNVSLLAQGKRKAIAGAPGTGQKFPDAIAYKVQSFYRHRPDGKPGREVMLYFKGAAFTGSGMVEVMWNGHKETVPVTANNGIDSLAVLLPDGAGVKSAGEATLTLRSGKKELTQVIRVPALRQWTVYIYPHSHVDIGYTNTQENVELIHKRNLINGIKLAKETVNYPIGARYTWNPEVLWPVERYLRKATPAEKNTIIDAVQKGYLHLDASYVNTNTSMAADEEMFEFFGHCREMEQLTGTKISTMVQVDVPGMSWGIVPVAAAQGIRYIFAMNNGSDRVGRSTELSFKPFWWKSADGKSKVLFFQPGAYTPGENAKGHDYWPVMAGQTDTSKLLQIVKTNTPRAHFVDNYLAKTLPALENASYYPYDIFAMSWAMADNTPIDADLPDAVKSWNEDYAFPHLVISGATEFMSTFEKKYGDQLPVLSGDFTEYWTDGLGAAAKQTSMNRSTKEQLIQTETLWTMLHPGEAAPRAAIKEAWRNVSMGTEHTWCYMDPSKQPITNDILQVKFGYFQHGADISDSVRALALSSVTQNGQSTIAVFNTLSWVRSGLVLLSKEQSEKFSSISDNKGKPVLSQRLSTGELVFIAKDIPALGQRNYFLKKEKGNNSRRLVHDNILDNGLVRVVINPQTGDISSLTSGAKEFADSASPAKLNSYRYLHGDDSPEKASGTSDVKISIKENGPLLATIMVESSAEGCNSLIREITIIAGQPYVDIKNIVDKQPILKKEGIHFGFAFKINTPATHMDIPWGIVKIDDDQLTGANRNWIGFQRWVDVSGPDMGVTWCSLDAPVFEVGNMTANIIGSATNSEKWIKKIDPSATIYSWALNNHWHTNFPLSQEGKITFRYRLLPHNTGYDAGLSNRFGLEQLQPLMASPVKDNKETAPLLSLQGDKKIVISILKTDSTGDVVQIRLRSVSDKDESVKLNWLSRKPTSVALLGDNTTKGKKQQEEILVPAMGFVTVEAKFAR